jgi:UDP-glucuronate decarboxylase
MSRILVTGGAGFIGSHLCDVLIQKGHEVIALDNFFTGRRINVEKLQENSRFELIRHDIVESILLEVDKVFHLACPASPIHYQYNPVKTVKTSVTGTLNVLGLAKRVKASFLLASTSEVYGDPIEHPQKESYWGNVNTIGPRSCYDEGKRVAETLTYCYHKEHDVNASIVRIFNTYGPRMLFEDGRVVSNFILQALRGEDITIYGDGTQTRSFCFVDDLVRGLLMTMDKDDFFGPVNLGNPEETTIKELAEMIIELTGSSSKVIHMPLPQDDPMRRRPDISRAESVLGWRPLVSLKEGLMRTISDFEGRLTREN